VISVYAQGPEANQNRAMQLEPNRDYLIGRDAEADFCIDWDRAVSAQQAVMRVDHNQVKVTQRKAARNPLYFNGQIVDECNVPVGSLFVLGQTQFVVQAGNQDSHGPLSPPVEKVTFDRAHLKAISFRDADRRIDVLSRLPEVIWGARNDADFYHRLANLLLAGLVHADAVAMVEIKPGSHTDVEVLHWDRRHETAGQFRPSSRLVSDSFDQHNSVLHIWDAAHRDRDDGYTAVAEFDWAFCTSVPTADQQRWGLYVAGKLNRPFPSNDSADAQPNDLQADVKFTELVAEIISAVQRLNTLERRQATLRQFFAPPVLQALGEDLNTDLLEPRECDVTVLFCDLRGFSQRAEESADNLIALLDRVSCALEVMTKQILAHGGVPCDFQGDAALGFWGWPLPDDQSAIQACRAALAILQEFQEKNLQADHPLAAFEVGIGLAHGRAVAGKIGTSDHVKVTVFGPVVNLASRLEGMTRPLHVPILMDEATAQLARMHLPGEAGRVRKLAKILPYGMETSLIVSELLPSLTSVPEISDAVIKQYENGVEKFIAGDWEAAYRELHAMPANDRASDFLMMRITQHNRIAPADWDGVIPLSK